MIYSSEIVNAISRMLQLIKYFFDDDRSNKDASMSMDNSRGIICQIQIVTSVFSDYCSFLGTLLLCLKCYKIIKNTKKFLDKEKNLFLPILYVIIISSILSLGLLMYDRIITEGNTSYRFDVRDICSYWCWLNHIPSIVCYLFYTIIISFNIVYIHKVNKCFTLEIKKVNSQNDLMSEQKYIDSPSNELNDELNISFKQSKEKKKIQLRKIEEFKLIKLKCFIYFLAFFIIWLVGLIYRLFDDLLINYKFDQKSDSPSEGNKKEKEYFTDHPFLQFIVQFLLVLHTFVSSVRGIFYGILFIVEINKFTKITIKDEFSEEERENNKLLTNSNISTTNEFGGKKEKENEENTD